MNIDTEKTIRTYMTEVIHLSLATSRDNKPWVCEVHYAFDANLNIYFLSLPSTRHSQDIAKNNRVAGTIVKQHAVGEKPRGVYFEGTAKEMTNITKTHIAYVTSRERFGIQESVIQDVAKKEGHKFYGISVETFYLFDRKESEPGQMYMLPWQKKTGAV